MSQPQSYNRQYNFINYQMLNPADPLPAAQVEAEYNAVKITLDQTLSNLALIQRDDGKLANGSVGSDQLAASLSIGFTLRGAWTFPVNYITNDGVTYNAVFYRAKSSHLSVFGQTPDLHPELWELLVDFNNFAPVVIGDGTVITQKLADGAVTIAKMSVVPVIASGSQSLSNAQKLQANTNTSALLVGETKTWNGPLLPAGFLWENGAAISRSTYSALLQAITLPGTINTTSGSLFTQMTVATGTAAAALEWIGVGTGLDAVGISGSTVAAAALADASTLNITLSAPASATALGAAARLFPHGNGDGSTTFNVPDSRGRTRIGRDNMGGTAASRVTGGVSGLTGTRLGASGGDQRMQSHAHDIGGFSGNSNLSGGAQFLNTNQSNTVGSTLTAGAGGSQNVQPSLVGNFIIYAGV